MDKKIIIEYNIVDDKLYTYLKIPSDQTTNYSELLNVMVTSLSMTIRMSNEYMGINDGVIFKDVINALEKEFINPDSLNDLNITKE